MIRHIIKMKLYVVIFSSLIVCFDETINIPLDPIYHNSFYISSIHPEYQPDLDNDFLPDLGQISNSIDSSDK